MNIEMEDSGSYIVFSFSVRRWGQLQKMMQSNGFGHKWLIGSWKGTQEPACIVNAVNFAAILKTGLLDDQDAFLELGPLGRQGRPAALLAQDCFFPSPLERKPKGTFKEVTLGSVCQFTNWTFDPSTGKAFVALP